MRNLVYFSMLSLDGYIEDARRSLEWVIVDRELHQFINERQAALGAYLYGRRMYEMMSVAWPAAGADPANPDYILDFAEIWKAMPKIVFSQTLEKVEWNSRLVREDPAKEVVKLKAGAGKDLEVGGVALAGALIKLGLVDEYQLFVQPVVLGSGTPLFPPLDDKIDLRLVESHTFSTGVIYLRYQVAK